MAITADANGTVTGQFQIPQHVSAGSKRVEFQGVGGSHATASFFGQGTLVENVMQKVTKSTLLYYDPLAQTFYFDEMRQMVGVDLFVEVKGPTPIVVHLRETSNGYPTQTIVAEATLQPNEITEGGWNRFLFERPTTVLGNVEYAIVVMCNDATASIGIAELGKYSQNSQQWVTSQSPHIGVLLSSSNASTWTAHQDRDMAIRLLAARYTETERIIDLGKVEANAHTDALVLSIPETPASETTFSLLLTKPDGSQITVGNNQSLTFAPAITGDVNIKAKLTGNSKVSAAVFPGTILALGTVEQSAEYVSRAFDADAADSDVRVTYSAYAPSGSTVKCYLADDTNPPTWEEIPQSSTPAPLGDGSYEFQHLKTAFNKARCRIRIVLTGTTGARPVVMDLRGSVS